MSEPRIPINHYSGLLSTSRVYRTDKAIEVDESDRFEIRRRRVFFDDVVLATYHHERGRGLAISAGIVVTILAIAAIISTIMHAAAMTGAFVVLALPFLAIACLRLAIKTDVITISGQRTRASLRFFLRKRLARDTFEDLVNRIRAVQQVEAPAEVAAEPHENIEEPALPTLPPGDQQA